MDLIIWKLVYLENMGNSIDLPLGWMNFVALVDNEIAHEIHSLINSKVKVKKIKGL